MIKTLIFYGDMTDANGNKINRNAKIKIVYFLGIPIFRTYDSTTT